MGGKPKETQPKMSNARVVKSRKNVNDEVPAETTTETPEREGDCSPAICSPPPFDPPKGSFQKELEHLINCKSIEGGSDTPDFILADYLMDCLAAFDKAVSRRTEWYRPEDSTREVDTE